MNKIAHIYIYKFVIFTQLISFKTIELNSVIRSHISSDSAAFGQSDAAAAAFGGVENYFYGT